MKEENRKILDELIREHSCRYARPSGLSDKEYESIDKSNNHEDKICEFLNSIPQIESHLCLGGYIQDKNGKPCCHGDKVIYDENYEGTLEWDKKNVRFVISSIYGDYDFTQIKSFVKI